MNSVDKAVSVIQGRDLTRAETMLIKITVALALAFALASMYLDYSITVTKALAWYYEGNVMLAWLWRTIGKSALYVSLIIEVSVYLTLLRLKPSREFLFISLFILAGVFHLLCYFNWLQV